MEDLQICAVMVTLQPKSATLTNLSLLAEQVKKVVLVDNGSDASTVELLSAACCKSGSTLIRNDVNQGIAAALNTGVAHALAAGFRWVALFDQDSTVTPGFIDAMVDGYKINPGRDAVGIFCPVYIDRVTGLAVTTSKVDLDGSPIVAMTSGSLMPTWIFERCGWFMEELFVDQVDVEYCFRLRAAGYSIARSPDARLLHSAGMPRIHHVWGLPDFHASHHDANRRYYITRNRLYMMKQVLKLHPFWSLTILRSIVSDTIKIFLVEDLKLAKLQSTLLGIRDALVGKLGKKLDQ